MTGIRFLISRRMYNTCLKSNNHVMDTISPSFTCIGRDYSTGRSTRSNNNTDTVSPRLSNLQFKTSSPLLGTTYMLNHRFYSSSSGNHGEDVSASASSGPEAGGFDGNDLVHKMKEAWNSTVDVATQTGEKAKEAYGEVSPYVEQLLDTHPYLRDVIVPVSGSILGTFAAWVVLPRIFRRFHKYATEGPGTYLQIGSLGGPVPYEKSMWGALEVPVRYLITFMAFSQIGVMVAPTTIASQFIGPAWKSAVIVSFIWFLHRWKKNVVARALAMKPVEGVIRDRLLLLDKLSSAGLFAVGGLALAEALGVDIQTILTVGGVGGIATALAARESLGNVFSGLLVQLQQPFSVGDTIKVGSVEGQVKELGLTATILVVAGNKPIRVPNTLFSSQAITNNSRAEWQPMVSKILVQIDDFEKKPQILEEIKSMMKSNINVFLDKEQPYCHVSPVGYFSRLGESFSELSLRYNLKPMNKDELIAAEQDVLSQTLEIIKKHGASDRNQQSIDKSIAAEREVLLQYLEIVKKRGANDF
ncbi:mechanosensitive ion channel protein 1, mitochondrial-like [Bidens hawaiensis]|uniref:mechanosensitive ion channel protein 1, mitochondrial-like n=1 Tax=Bidens hawaiensis TaxID=980011 RepID=UPI00404ACB85